jgi:toxin ParE1/3/4
VIATVVLTLEARRDIAESARWYRERSVRAAGDFLDAVGVALARIEAHPTAQVIIDQETGARRALVRKFPHRVLYLIEGDQLVVFAILHHGRGDPAWRKRI